MATLTSPVTFVASASITLTPPAGNIGNNWTGALPAVDGSNVAMTVTNNTGGAVFFQFGTTASVQTDPTSATSTRVEAGQTILLKTGAGAATYVGVTALAPGSVIFTRGTATAAEVFQ